MFEDEDSYEANYDVQPSGWTALISVVLAAVLFFAAGA